MPGLSDLTSKAKKWGGGLASTLSSAGSAAGGALKGAATKIGKAFSDARSLVIGQTSTNEKPLKKLDHIWTSTQNPAEADLFPIGRPCKFNQQVDRYHRFGNYLRSKMSVIDLIPIEYQINFDRMAQIAKDEKEASQSKSNSSNKSTEGQPIVAGNVYSYSYDEKIKLFQKLCKHHGLPDKYAGIRLFTTDETTGNDTISIQYKDNTFQGLTDQLFSVGQRYRDIAQAILGSQVKEFSDKVIEAGSTATAEITKKLTDNQQVSELMRNLASMAGDMVMKGNKMTFPKVWQSTTYAGNLSVNIRLVSPYGHPKAVKEFILKPLAYLLILAAPQTINGVTYGGNIPVTIKAYGLNYTVLGSIASITFRRGGSDTSFNLYRQPLTVDLSIEFQTLFDAFAVADPSVFGESMKIDKNIFNDSMFSDPDNSNLHLYVKNENSMMITLGTILKSFRPVKILNMNVDPQVYGVFQPPTRDDIPETPPFTPLVGNLGSSISSAIASIEKFSSMVINAPTLIQQGLSNAIYNTAKGSVGSIAGKASSWLNAGSGAVSQVVNKVNALF